jgi:hypothetical protein
MGRSSNRKKYSAAIGWWKTIQKKSLRSGHCGAPGEVADVIEIRQSFDKSGFAIKK